MRERGQISIEYLIVVGFVTLLVITILGVSYLYANGIRDQIKTNQAQTFAEKVIAESEKVYYAGEPSKTTITAYLPEGVTQLEVAEQSIIISLTIGSNTSKAAYSSNVPINITISTTPGVKHLIITAQSDRVVVVEQ